MEQDLPASEEFVITEVLRRGLDDWAQMADVTDVLMHYAGITDPAVGQRVALRIVSEILRRGLMRPGNVKEHVGFVPYASEHDAIELLKRSWPVDHFPSLGEFPLWLQLTEAGTKWLQSRGLTWD